MVQLLVNILHKYRTNCLQ